MMTSPHSPSLSDRFRSLGHEVPTAVSSRGDLVALITEVGRQQATSSGSTSPTSFPNQVAIENSAPDRTIVELKSRLKELGVKAPPGEERREALVELLETAEGNVGTSIPTMRGYWDEAFRDKSELGTFTFRAEAPLSLTHTFSCQKGTNGVTALSFDQSSSSTLPALDVTMSAADAVKGTKFKWVRGEAIGRGSLGLVFQALDQTTGYVMAVKQVFLNCEEDVDAKLKQSLTNEINVLQDLQHPHIVSYLGHDHIDSCLYMYLEYMPGGSMAQVLQTFGAFEESLIADYTRQLLEGLVYLHTRDPPVVHRDIKGANILVGLDGRVKLADFGCSKRSQETMSYTLRGSVPWMAPEVIKHTAYGRSADIWSFGCVIIEMGSAKVPWGRFDNQLAAMVKIGMSKELPPLPDCLSETCQAFIKRCIARDAAARPLATELVDDPFVRDVQLPEC